MAVIISMGETIPGREVETVMDLAKGNVVRARFFGRDILAALRSVVGGEVPEYTKLMAEAREQALDRMTAHAERMGADAVISVRLTTSMIMQGAAEILAYGTAVKLKPENTVR